MMENLGVHAAAIAAVGAMILIAKWFFTGIGELSVCPRCKDMNTSFTRSAREDKNICQGCADIEVDGVDDLIL